MSDGSAGVLKLDTPAEPDAELTGVVPSGLEARSLRQSMRRRTPQKTTPRVRAAPETACIAISDPGQDLDDEMMFIMMRHLVEEGYLDLRGIITTLAPAHDRARLCRGTLNLLGMPTVAVGVGTDGGDTAGKHTAAPFEDGARSYMPAKNSEEAIRIEPGRKLLSHLYQEADAKSLTLLITASLKDAALFVRDNEKLFVSRTKEVVIMGGVQPTFYDPAVETTTTYHMAKGNYLEPDTSNNQTFDMGAANFLFRRCQEKGIPLVIVSRWCAYAAKMPRMCYDELAVSGSSIGRRLCNASRNAIEGLWTRAAAALDDPVRMGLPARCDRKWFINTFCGGKDDPDRTNTHTVWDLVDGFMQYDTMALLAAIPSLRDRFYSPVTVTTCAENGRTVENTIIGLTQELPNLREPKDELMKLLSTGFKAGLSLNHHFKAQVILVVEPREDTVVDMTLTIVMLRTLFELEAAQCIGIVVLSSGEEDGDDASERSIQGDAIRQTLNEVGLRFVPVFDANSTVRAAESLQNLYANALPMGVVLCLTTSLTAASTFVECNAQAFREKTAKVILMSGVRKRELDGQWLEPDPEAQNNRSDMASAHKFFTIAQELSVPLVVMSRFAARSGGHMPRALFDVLTSHCGNVGKSVSASARSQLEKLWGQVCAPLGSTERGSLPKRCDMDWFLQTFCDGKALSKNATKIWEHVTHFTVYSPLALLVILPEAFVTQCLQMTPVHIRAATHKVVGWSMEQDSVVDPVTLQDLLLHALLYGARCNVSEYDMGSIPSVRAGSNGSTHASASGSGISNNFDMSAAALVRQLPDFQQMLAECG